MLSVVKQYTPRWLRRWSGKYLRRMRLIAELGLVGSIATIVQRRLGTCGAAYTLSPRGADHRLYYRVGSSDLDVFHQIFIDREYAPLCDMRDVHVVIDCGANVGYSSAFFLSHFPSCRVIAVEPDPGNFAMLERNLRAYGTRAAVVRAGIWGESVPLRLSQEQYRDGREWAVQVQPCQASQTPDFQGMSIPSLLMTFGLTRITLLKIDIEGAEAVVFSGNVDWLDRDDAIAIELHDDSRFGSVSEIFHSAIRGRGFEISRSGELTICRRAGLTTSVATGGMQTHA